jgi:arylsulfatase A-like enzyme
LNFLLITADQFRHDCLGFRGLRGISTPNLDRLAGEGHAFTRAFTPLPVCAPARQALLCGRHPDSFGALWNYDMIATPTVRPEWCWTAKLPEHGYNTAYLGRFHVSPNLSPSDFGYRRHISWAEHRALTRDKYPALSFTGGWLGETSPVDVSDSGTHWMADRTVEMIRAFARSGKPWHIWVDFEEPHLPCRPSEPYASMYDPHKIEPWDGFGDAFVLKPYCHKQQSINWNLFDARWSDLAPMVGRYYGLITQLDDAIGRILNALDECGQADDTIAAFTADHGDMCGSHQTLDKHYMLYDDVVRAPLIVRYQQAGHSINDALVSNCLDLPASAVEWLGLPQPEIAHGRPLPLFKKAARPRDFITSSSNGQQFGLFNSRMIRDGRYKYVWNLTDTDEFYDLDADPGERHNLISETDFVDLISAMRLNLRSELISHGDPFAASGWLDGQLAGNRKHVP